MSLEVKTLKTNPADFLLSWDRLGFRVLVFGGLALVWILQGRVLHLAWPDLIRGELAGIMPWALLAPIVLAFGRRFRIERLGLGLTLVAHLLGMAVAFIPYWLLQRAILLLWACFASGWEASRLTPLIPTRENLVGNFVNVPFVYLLILLGAEAMKHAQARRDEEVQAGRLAGQLAEARLALLQRQLHPHFLFNALQAISTLLHRDPEKADRLLMRLSRLLRAMLEDASGQTLDLRTELELTRKYLEIEEVRFGDRLSVEWNLDESLLESPVPSLIVLPLVENAIRHGLSTKVGPGRLRISAGAEGASLALTVEDDGLGATLPLRPGVGIANTGERLETMYGGRAALDVDTVPDGGFRARIRISPSGEAAVIRALVVDDEPLVRERLCALLAAHADVEVVGERRDGPSALEAFRELAPQVVFLDIQMPGLSGLEVAETWRNEGALPVIVFVTAFDQFAVEAFRLHALDYLTKPIDPERFSESLDRVRESLKPQNRGDLDRRIQAMLDLHERRQAVRPHLVVRDHERYILVPTAGIHALEATGNYVTLHCERASHLLRSSLAATEGRLDPRRFLRTHRSWIVNLDHVREAQTVAKGAWILLTRSGLKVPVGQQYREALLKILG